MTDFQRKAHAFGTGLPPIPSRFFVFANIEMSYL